MSRVVPRPALIMVQPQPLSIKECLDYYEAGKHRRYTLLFAVNGGAFTLATLWIDDPAAAGEVLGGLTLERLALGMVLFSVVMVADIYLFGTAARRLVVSSGGPSLFGWQGRVVLGLLGLLIVAGWSLAGFG